MRNGPSKALEVVEDYIAIDESPLRVKELLFRIITGLGWFQGNEAREKAEIWEDRFISKARMVLNNSMELGNFQIFCFNSVNQLYIQGSCYCEPQDPPDVRDAKLRRSNTLQIYDFIRSKSAEDLEKICRKMLGLLGVAEPQATPRSGDGGVDFYGYSSFHYLLKPEILPSGAEKNMRVWFVGQAKHYPNSAISTKEIREIVGASELARAKLFAGDKDPMKGFTARLCDPVFSIFVTTGRFSRDSIDLMRKSGIIPMDGPQLAQFLADHNIGIYQGLFVPENMSAWFAGA